MDKDTKELVKSIGLPPKPFNRVQAVNARTRPTQTKTVTSTFVPQQGFLDRFINGQRPPIVTTTIVPLDDVELVDREVQKHRLEIESSQARSCR